MEESLLIPLAVVVVSGAAAQWLAWRLALPSILLLLLCGFVAGPVLGLLDTDKLMGDLLLPFVSLSVALILYEGGLSLKFSELSAVGTVVRNLVTVGMLLTWAVGTATAYLLFDLGPALAALLGAILVVTGPTVIIPLLRHIRPTGPAGSALKWEGIVIDPLGALLAVLVFEVTAQGPSQQASAQIAWAVLKTVIAGGGLGLLGAALITLLLHRYWVPDFLQNAVSLMLVVAAFTVSNLVQHESGLLAVTVMGIALANQKYVDVRHIVEFKENLRVLLLSALFVLLAARLKVADLRSVALPAAAFVGIMVVIARPAAVLASTAKSKLNTRERAFLACMAPRGIVAAAVASVFALRMEHYGYEEAGLLVPVTFAVIVGTVAIYGLGAPLAARALKVADPNPQGILFVGAHAWVRALAEVLKEKGIRVLLVDTNRSHTAAARMAGLPTYTGSVLADYALDEIDLGGLGRLFALTPNEWVNALANQRFAPIFGRAECYELPPEERKEKRRTDHRRLHGRRLFAEGVTDARMRRRFAAGAIVKATPISETFGFEEFTQRYGNDAIPLLLLKSGGRLTVFTASDPPKPQSGMTLISLVDEPDEDEAGQEG